MTWFVGWLVWLGSWMVGYMFSHLLIATMQSVVTAQARYAREKLSVRESDRRPPLAFCPNVFPSVAHHHRERMHSIRRFWTKLTFRRNILRSIAFIENYFCYSYDTSTYFNSACALSYGIRTAPAMYMSTEYRRIPRFLVLLVVPIYRSQYFYSSEASF